MIVAALILTLCHSLESDTKKGTIQEGAICDELEAEQAIIELHDDLDDDDDGAISTTENNAFNDEYGISSGSISAFIDDIDGKVSSAEFLQSWKRSPVYSWSPDQVIEWLGTMKLKPSTMETLKRQIRKYNISGRCFPLISQDDKLLKRIGIKQHLIKRKLMLKTMDAILFGPPVYDNAIKDFALAFSLVMVLVLIVSIISQKRENKRIGDLLDKSNQQITMIDKGWRDFNADGSTTVVDSDSQSTLNEIDLNHYKSVRDQNNQLRKSLEEAHKELRQLQTGQQSDTLHISAELKSLLRRTHDGEKAGLTFRTEEALKIQAHAKEAYLRLQRANSSFFGSIRLIHSPTQLSTFDQSIREAQLALDSVAQLRRDFSDRWRDLERLMHTQLRSRSQQDYNTPSTTRKTDNTQGDEMTSQRLSGEYDKPPTDLRKRLRHQPNSLDSNASSIGLHFNPSVMPSSSVKPLSSSTDRNSNKGAFRRFPSNSIETASMTSSTASHVKIKSDRSLLPKWAFKNSFIKTWSKRHKRKSIEKTTSDSATSPSK